jgi:DNA-binding transcriptional ArsR family regulator
MLQRRDAHPVFGPWRSRTHRDLPRSARPLLQLLSPLGSGPMFLDPSSSTAEEGMDLVLSTSAAAARAELRRVCAIDRPATAWVRGLAERDREAWQILQRAMYAAYAHLVAGSWHRIQAGFDADAAWRARILLRQGLRAALTSLSPAIRLRGTTLEADHPRDVDITLEGEGIILQPSLFWTGHPLVSWHADGRLLLIYPAVTPLPLLAAAAAGDPLSALLGATRARALLLLGAQRTTTDLARELTVTTAAASMQAKTLREAGLITSRRDGKAVWHWCTPLGLDLIAAGGPGRRDASPDGAR